jgi:ADP-ribose pyrophosphatase YjhB (NUDIX family)
MYKRNSHCSFCGTAFSEGAFPKKCATCERTTYLNPTPVAVTLLPVDGGVLTVRRGIEPRKGQLALPGGFITLGESWQEAGARELFEETGITIDPTKITHFQTLSAPDGTLLIFGLAQPVRAAALPEFVPNEETAEIVVLEAPAELAFSLHTSVLADYFAQQKRS